MSRTLEQRHLELMTIGELKQLMGQLRSVLKRKEQAGSPLAIVINFKAAKQRLLRTRFAALSSQKPT